MEDEIADYERQTGRRAPAERQRQETFSGYTLSLVDSVTKLTRYLKEVSITGRRAPVERQKQETFISYALSLVDFVSKLTKGIFNTSIFPRCSHKQFIFQLNRSSFNFTRIKYANISEKFAFYCMSRVIALCLFH